MKLNHLVLRSMKKNIKQYFLYFFALIFSVALYFSFVTLQYNEDVLTATASSGSATSGFEAATYMLYFITLFFVLYANHLFIKRRSKELGMYQLIGMSKGLVFRLIAIENILLFIGAIIAGIVVGFLSSRLFVMILMKLMHIEAIAGLALSEKAIVKTCGIFAVLLVIILIQIAIMLKRVTLLTLFSAAKNADERVKRIGVLQVILGILGFLLVAYGYYLSTILFEEEQYDNLFRNMIVILATTIGGTFFIFRYTVSIVLNVWRKRKKGHLSIIDVVGLTPVMHRMKGNAKSLTLISVLTAVSLTIVTLSYISYSSIEENARSVSPGDFTLYDDHGKKFTKLLDDEGIAYEAKTIHLYESTATLWELQKVAGVYAKNSEQFINIIPASDVDKKLSLKKNEAMIYTVQAGGTLGGVFQPGDVTVKDIYSSFNQRMAVKEIRNESIIGDIEFFAGTAFVVNDDFFYSMDRAQQTELTKEMLVSITNDKQLKQAEALYTKHKLHEYESDKFGFTQKTYNQAFSEQAEIFGVIVFITGFLGLAFLLATCSILYFKQMSEADEEREAFTILRKMGYSYEQMRKGLFVKQLLHFGLPLFIGLVHSCMAVKSGWFLFGSSMVMPMITMASLYIIIYFVFALLATRHYKRVIDQSL